MHLEYIGRGGIFKIYTLLPFSRHPSCRFLNWSKNCVLVILFFFSSVPDRKLLMTAAGSIHNHLGWLGLWPLAESDNSELRDFYPPLNSKREPEREREKGGTVGLIKRKEKHIWETRCKGEDEKRHEVEEGVEAQKKVGGSHFAAHPRGADIIWERQASKRGEVHERRRRTGKRWNKEEWNVASDVLQKYLTFTWFWCVKSRQLESSKRPPVLSLSLSLSIQCWKETF